MLGYYKIRKSSDWEKKKKENVIEIAPQTIMSVKSRELVLFFTIF